jgi:hypothetical protein
MSPNDYNTLGVGTTQLYNERWVCNHKRHGIFTLGNRKIRFVRKPFVPGKLTREFLLVDLVNNVKLLAEDQSELMDKVKRRATEMDSRKQKNAADVFGTIRTRKLFNSLLG